eukprot:3930467-Rhodomonas_salina.1
MARNVGELLRFEVRVSVLLDRDEHVPAIAIVRQKKSLVSPNAEGKSKRGREKLSIQHFEGGREGLTLSQIRLSSRPPSSHPSTLGLDGPAKAAIKHVSADRSVFFCCWYFKILHFAV